MAFRIICLGVLTGAVLLGQSGEAKIDTTQVHVISVIALPHHAGPSNRSPLDRVFVFLNSGQMTITDSAGQIERLDIQAGDLRWIPAGQSFSTENTGDKAIKVVEIEIKNKPPRPPMPTTQLDPTIVDSGHYKVAFENEQVRVLRVRYGPHEGGSRHEHILNRVVCYITDQANGKAGEVHISGAMTHSEENSLDQPVERIAVELK